MCMNLDSRRFPIHARYVVIFTSILLKNSSFHLHRHRLSWSESGCKDKAFSRFPPNLSRSFFELFFRAPRLKVTRRERSSSTTPERHRHANSPSPRLAPRSVLAGAKIRQRFPLFQIFQPLFYQLFQSILVFNAFRGTFHGPGACLEPGGNDSTTRQQGDKDVSRTLPNVLDTSLMRPWCVFNAREHRARYGNDSEVFLEKFTRNKVNLCQYRRNREVCLTTP